MYTYRHGTAYVSIARSRVSRLDHPARKRSIAILSFYILISNSVHVPVHWHLDLCVCLFVYKPMPRMRMHATKKALPEPFGIYSLMIMITHV